MARVRARVRAKSKTSSVIKKSLILMHPPRFLREIQRRVFGFSP